MPDYKKMYFELAARVADAVELLVSAQQSGEDTYADEQNHPAISFPPTSHNQELNKE